MQKTNEDILVDKILNLPVPQMQDGIWQAIASRLDKPDGPPEQTGKGGGNGAGTNFMQYSFGIISAIIIVACIILIKKPSPAPQKNLPPAVSVEKQVEPAQKTTKLFSDSVAIEPYEILAKKTVTPSKTSDLSMDSMSNRQSFQPIVIDSGRLMQSAISLTPPDSISLRPIVAAPDKKKGIKGLSDSDYKIVPQKKN